MSAADLHEEDQVDGVSGDSLMGRLREKRQQLASQKTIDIPIAGYSGELVARYRLLDPLVEGREIAKRIEQQTSEVDERMYFAIVDALIEACEGLYVRREHDDPKLVPLDPDGNGQMVYEPRLAEFLGFDGGGTARECVLGVFAGNRLAVIAHGQQLQEWMRDTSGELSKGLRPR